MAAVGASPQRSQGGFLQSSASPSSVHEQVHPLDLTPHESEDLPLSPVVGNLVDGALFIEQFSEVVNGNPGCVFRKAAKGHASVDLMSPYENNSNLKRSLSECNRINSNCAVTNSEVLGEYGSNNSETFPANDKRNSDQLDIDRNRGNQFSSKGIPQKENRLSGPVVASVHIPLAAAKSSPLAFNFKSPPRLTYNQDYSLSSSPKSKTLSPSQEYISNVSSSPPRRILIATTDAAAPIKSTVSSSSTVSPLNTVVQVSINSKSTPKHLLLSSDKSPFFLNSTCSSANSSPVLHKPLLAQRSSPSLHRSLTPKASSVTSPKSPLLFSKSIRKFSCSKVTRISPTRFKNNFLYSKVHRSDSAYSEEPFASSPVPSYSPSLNYSFHSRELPNSETSYSDFNYTFSPGIVKSDSAYSEQYTNSSIRRPRSFPKSRSTIFRSDSAYSDIEYSYSTIPQFDSFYQDEDCSFSSLPKSSSVYSYNIFNASGCGRKSLIPRSFSAHNPRFKASREGSPTDGDSAAIPLVHASSQTVISSDIGKTKHCLVPKSQSNHSFSLSSSPTSLIMPTLKSLLWSPTSRSNRNPNCHQKNSVASVHSLHTELEDETHEQVVSAIKKSHTVLALSHHSSSSVVSVNASTKLHHGTENCFEARPVCTVSDCLSKALKKSISQTLNRSFSGNLNVASAVSNNDPASKTAHDYKMAHKSNLTAYLPHSFARTSSFTPSVTSVGSCIESVAENSEDTLYCRLCLMDVSVQLMCQLSACQCRFCKLCLTEYTRLKIEDGEHRIDCPDASCGGGEGGRAGKLSQEEIESLAGHDMLLLRNRLKLSAEVAADPYRAWCPKPGCENIIILQTNKFASVFPPLNSGKRSKKSKNKTKSTAAISKIAGTSVAIDTPVLPDIPGSLITLSLDNIESHNGNFSSLDTPEKKRSNGTDRSVYAPNPTIPNETNDSMPRLVNKLSTESDQNANVSNRILNSSLVKSFSNSRDAVKSPLDVQFSDNKASRCSSSNSSSDTVNVTDTICDDHGTNEDLINTKASNGAHVKELNYVELRNAGISTCNVSTQGNQFQHQENESNLLLSRNLQPSNVSKSETKVSSRPRGFNNYFPEDPVLSATLAALQSPAEYRSFAALQSPAEYRVNAVLPSNGGRTVDQKATESTAGALGVEFAMCDACSSVFCPRCSMLDGHPGAECPAIGIDTSDQVDGLRRHYKKLLGGTHTLQAVIKMCPKCRVPIERNEGCAQMQCRACKHTFCWYCLASLEDDFMLRHYDNGPCRNKLGHSRASVLCHRLQVIAIFVGVGLLGLAMSPVLLLIGPCVVCCKWCWNSSTNDASVTVENGPATEGEE